MPQQNRGGRSSRSKGVIASSPNLALIFSSSFASRRVSLSTARCVARSPPSVRSECSAAAGSRSLTFAIAVLCSAGLFTCWQHDSSQCSCKVRMPRHHIRLLHPAIRALCVVRGIRSRRASLAPLRHSLTRSRALAMFHCACGDTHTKQCRREYLYRKVCNRATALHTRHSRARGRLAQPLPRLVEATPASAHSLPPLRSAVACFLCALLTIIALCGVHCID